MKSFMMTPSARNDSIASWLKSLPTGTDALSLTRGTDALSLTQGTDALSLTQGTDALSLTHTYFIGYWQSSASLLHGFNDGVKSA